jgi:hypothetical protein
MALDIEDRDVSSDPDHGHSGKRLQRAKFTDKIHSLASLVSAPYGVHGGWKMFHLEPMLHSISFNSALICVFCSETRRAQNGHDSKYTCVFLSSPSRRFPDG